MNGLLAAMGIFINSLTGLPVLPAGGGPAIEVISTCDMTHLVHGPSASCEVKAGEPHVRGLYLGVLDRIYLPDDFDEKSPLDLSILLHELTHAMQRSAGRPVSCFDKELQAYTVQGQFLLSQGLDPVAEIGFTSATEGAEASCRFTQGERK